MAVGIAMFPRLSPNCGTTRAGDTLSHSPEIRVLIDGYIGIIGYLDSWIGRVGFLKDKNTQEFEKWIWTISNDFWMYIVLLLVYVLCLLKIVLNNNVTFVCIVIGCGHFWWDDIGWTLGFTCFLLGRPTIRHPSHPDSWLCLTLRICRPEHLNPAHRFMQD